MLSDKLIWLLVNVLSGVTSLCFVVGKIDSYLFICWNIFVNLDRHIHQPREFEGGG